MGVSWGLDLGPDPAWMGTHRPRRPMSALSYPYSAQGNFWGVVIEVGDAGLALGGLHIFAGVGCGASGPM